MRITESKSSKPARKTTGKPANSKLSDNLNASATLTDMTPVSDMRNIEQAGDSMFEQHAALLGEPGLSQPMYARQKADVVRRIGRDYGNSYVQRLVEHVQSKKNGVVQSKLVVGPAGDKYEREADRVAKQVMAGDGATLQRQEEEEELQMKPVQRSVDIGLEGGAIDSDAMQTIQGERGKGQGLPDGVRTKMEGAFGADFSGVRLHTGPETDSLNESMSARAFTTGQDIFVRKSDYSPGSAAGQELLAHELTHVVQQNGSAVRVQEEPEVHRKIDSGATQSVLQSIPGMSHVQRHSSWEHRMLGDITPESLEIMGAGREEVKQDDDGREYVEIKVLQGDQAGVKKIFKEDILHTFEQEIERIEYFRDSPPKDASAESQAALVEADKTSRTEKAFNDKSLTAEERVAKSTVELGDDKKWQIRLVGISLKDGNTEVVSYGEVNTLADIYGSPDEIKVADPNNFRAILKGIRQQSLFKVMELYEEISGTTKYQDLAADARKQKRGEEGLLKGAARVGGGALGGVVGAVGGAVAGPIVGIAKGAKKGYEKGGGGVGGAALGTLGAIGGAILSPLTALYGMGKGAKKGAEIGAKGPSMEGQSKFAGLGFDGAIGSTGATSGLIGELRLMDMIPGAKGKKGTKGQEEATSYLSGLARNACHFPPESWHSWADYHESAIKLAEEAFKAKESAEGYAITLEGMMDLNQMAGGAFSEKDIAENIRQTEEEKATGAEKSNEAYLSNGFGDHFLQDSYAAGHLINKTQVMQWYVEFIDKTGTWDYHLNKNWRKAQDMAYKQPGLSDSAQYDKSSVDKSEDNPDRREARNPQSVENKVGGQGWKAIHDSLGLQVPSSLKQGSPPLQLLMWWQEDTLKKLKLRSPRKKTIKTLLNSGLFKDRESLAKALGPLYFDGIVRMADYDPGEKQQAIEAGFRKVPMKATVVLRNDYVPNKKQKEEFLKMTSSMKGTDIIGEISGVGPDGAIAQDLQNEKDTAYNQYIDKAKAVGYDEYRAFMRSSFIQKSTNALHDYFCVNGLDVFTGDSKKLPFKIYGDDNMLEKGSSAGVKHSAETANMSVKAIDDIISLGKPSGERTTPKIVDRFPDAVVGEDGNALSLAKWHEEGVLHKFADDNVFPDMSWSAAQKLAPGVLGKDLGKIHEDPPPHSGEKF